MWLARNRDGSLKVFARPPRRFHEGSALEPSKIGFNDTISLGNDEYSFWAIQEHCNSNIIDDYRSYGIDISTEIVNNGKKYFITYAPECSKNITWEDEPVEVEITQKPLKNRVQPKQEWSEEDEDLFDDIVRYIRESFSGFVSDRYIRMLKSLKPQNHWKPTEEQMEALANALSLAKNCGEENAFDLRTLYEQLKKL